MKKTFTVLVLIIIALGCQKERAVENFIVLPTITTTPASAVNSNAALCGGYISNDGGDSVIQRGVCWDTLQNPVITNSHTSDGVGMGTFTSSLTSLLSATTYYIRAYAVNSAGTAYGNEITIQTSTGLTLPSLTTSAATGINTNSLTSGGNILNTGGTSITERGVCWSTNHNPIKTDSHSTDGMGIGSFVSNVTPLVRSTTYYLRAYATNGLGTAYGNEITVITLDHDIYVGGAGPYTNATIWKNGISTFLTDSTHQGYVNCIAVSNNDVYAGGIELIGGVWVAKVWKNGEATSLTDGSNDATVTSIYVNGADVYVGGREGQTAKIWKNGISTSLSNGTYVTSLFAAGADIYVCGDYYNYPVSYALSWKNGVFSDLTDRTLVSNANSVFVSGTDVYIGGRENMEAKIWKNGIPISLSDGTLFNMVNAVRVQGNDVYALGFEMLTPGGISVAKYWKNGVANTLTNGTNSATTNSIFVFGSDVFVGGIDNGNITIWKNGIPNLVNVAPVSTNAIYMD